MLGGRSTIRMVLAGVLALMTGLQFAAGALTARAASGRRAPGILLAVIVAAGMYFLGGLQASLMTAACGAALAVASAREMSLQRAAALAAGLATAAAAAGLLEGPGLMYIPRAELDTLLPAWAGEGLGAEGRESMLEALSYLSPGLGAVQTVAGSALATAFFALAGGFRTIRREDLRLGLVPAWLLIVCLAATLLPARIPPLAAAAAHNSLLFLVVPYFAVGAAIAGEALRSAPALLVPAALLVVFATPLSIAAVAMTGLLDTWFDFRKKLRSKPGSIPL